MFKYKYFSDNRSMCGVPTLGSAVELPYRMIKSRWLVGTDDLFTVETIHSSRVSKFWFFFEILDLMTI